MTALSLAVAVLAVAVALLGSAVIVMSGKLAAATSDAKQSVALSTRLASDVISWTADVRALHANLKLHNQHACHLDKHLRDLDRYVQGLAKLCIAHEKVLDEQRRQMASHADWPSLSARLALVEMRLMPAIDDWPAVTAANELADDVVAKGGVGDGKESS